MPIQATVILDSGCFLPRAEGGDGKSTEIGYFGSSKSVSDIRVLADGVEQISSSPINLGKGCIIEVRHAKSSGQPKMDGVKASPTFHGQLLHMKDLYGQHMPVDRARFDCILHFDTGYFCSSLVKPRYFEEHKKQSNGKFMHTEECKRKLVSKPVAHNVLVHFKINNGESLQLLRDGEVFWSSKDSGVKDRLEIEIVADNSTVERFYRRALKEKRDSYWLPNFGDPPPVCPDLPCDP
ncbi:MAG TPA: hypothetical protein VF747_16395 [Blastocatellia bacterium]|jgi:hypothetical protein